MNVRARLSWITLALAAAAHAQNFSQRGFLETTGLFYPQAAPNDSAHAVGSALFRYETFYKLTNLRFAAGIDARFDTHQQTGRDVDGAWWDRTRRRPPFSVRRLSATYSRGRLTAEAGKQLIRWGKADVLTPTDRFAPRDFLNVVDSEFLPITAARVNYGTQANTLEVIFSPRLTPSRVPLLNQRWAVLPPGIPIHEVEPDFPAGPQFGARWNHIGSIAEYSLSFYNGYDHLPLFRVQPNLALSRADVQRFYPQMRMYGGDAAAPLGPVTLKGEAAYFTSTNPQADDYVLWVLQVERQAGEWSFVGGYAGQVVTTSRHSLGFSPVRGFTRAIVTHAGYTIDVNRSLAFEAVVRQNGDGVYAKGEYSQALGAHWRVTAGAALLRGDPADFLGQYRLNSHATVTVRYSF
ncbi:MAG: DUF1302 family protein [Candidatus Solibacter sp.]